MNEEQLLAQLEQLGVSQADLELLSMLSGVLLVVAVISLVLTFWLARRKRLNVSFWVLMALLFGPFALLVILFVPARETPVEAQR